MGPHIHRTRFHTDLLEASISGLPGDLLERLRGELEAGRHVCDVACDAGLMVPGSADDLHLRKHWYGPDREELYWPEFRVAEIVAYAYRRLIELYCETKRPILVVWLEGVDTVAVPIVSTKFGIFATVMTPMRPEGAAAPGFEIEDPDEVVGLFGGIVVGDKAAGK